MVFLCRSRLPLPLLNSPMKMLFNYFEVLARRLGWAACLVPVALVVSMSAMSGRAEEKKVSYYKELVPVFKRSCTGCHHPGKLKGELDLTTYAAFKKGA